MSNKNKMKRVGGAVLFGLFIAVLVGVCFFAIYKDGGRVPSADDVREFSIEINYSKVMAEQLKLPFEYVLNGEENVIGIRFERVDKAFPCKGRVEVVLSGTASMRGKDADSMPAPVAADMRFSCDLVVDVGQNLRMEGFQFDGMAIQSENGSANVIIERCGLDLWKAFAKSFRGWRMPLGDLPFCAGPRVRLEEGCVFVFPKTQD